MLLMMRQVKADDQRNDGEVKDSAIDVDVDVDDG